MQTMEEQTTNEGTRRLEERMDERYDQIVADQKAARKELCAEFRALRSDIKTLKRTMLYGFCGLDGLMLILIGFQLA
jgi:hypothetical protein